MQGTVWGSLYCTATMDKLAQLMYKEDELLYKYKGVVDTPCLGMVDDLLIVQKCSNNSVKANAVTNAFVEMKKLKFNKDKCFRIHISKQSKKSKTSLPCPELKVHEESMKNSNREKYLGDKIDGSGTPKATIDDRKSRGYAAASEILAILKDIPLGEHKMEIGLHLRQAMLINAILFNSEAWHNVVDDDLKVLEAIDEHLLRSIVQGHAKTPLEFLYLETGAVPIRHIISGRRIMYLQTILKRSDNELTKRILVAQKNQPSHGDFVNLVDSDLKKVNLNLDYDEIETLSPTLLKNMVKKKVREAAYKHLRERQSTHSKVRNIEYKELKCQPYITSSLFSNEEVNLLHKLRSCSVNCKVNFKGRHGDDLACPLCVAGGLDNQPHILKCSKIVEKLSSTELANHKVKYEDIFGEPSKQKVVTALFQKMLKIRESLLENQNETEI